MNKSSEICYKNSFGVNEKKNQKKICKQLRPPENYKSPYKKKQAGNFKKLYYRIDRKDNTKNTRTERKHQLYNQFPQLHRALVS